MSHQARFVGHPERKGIKARWGWICSCGVKTRYRVLTLLEAKWTWANHAEKNKSEEE